jgi:hypothetical protein
VKPALLTLLIAIGLAVGSIGRAAQEATPTLTIVDRSPLIVRGTEFKKRERVVVTVSTEAGNVRRAVRSSSRGRFLVRFDAIRIDPCTGATLEAVGARGDLARLKIGLRQCPGPVFEP